MENVRFCLGAQQLRIPFPHLPAPSHPGPYMGPLACCPHTGKVASWPLAGREETRSNWCQRWQIVRGREPSPDSRAQLGGSWGAEQMGQV